MTAIVVCNGSVSDYSYYKRFFDKAGLIICADGGAAHLKRFGITPHILLGDFDSISQEDLRYFESQGTEIMKFPAEKDMTDTELAVEIAIDKGCKTIIFIGALGTRFDHSMSNIFMLRRILSRGVRGIIVNESNEITLIQDKIELQKEEGIKITLLPLSDKVKGVTTKGLYYPLNNATIEMGSTWGVSNEFVDAKAEVSITDGLLLVIKARD
ncbi:MAG: thiamine diphosphokinase [Clostridia bacterium]|nr:thiamine diphosphokinase [Clostridia bacterium]